MVKPRFNVTLVKQDGGYAQFVLEPLERGYGHTLGNSLRRVLLSSIPGHAITRVKIKGVDHPFSTLKGVTEDIVDILLNLKGVRLQSSLTDPSTLRISVKGGVVTAKNIQCPAGMSVINTDHHIATLSDGVTLEMEMTAEFGLGYSPADEREITDISGELAVDAIYSPIMKVAYEVEQTRVGHRTDYDRLIIDMWTDGSVDARATLDQAADILIRHFQQVVNPEDVIDRSSTLSVKPADEIGRLTIEELDLPTRIANALRKGGYNVVADLMKAKRSQVALVKNLGGKSIEIVEEAMTKVGAVFAIEEESVQE